MGHGAARELATETGPLKPLPEALSAKVGEALAKMDAHDEGFKERRDDERYTQNVKKWGRVAKGMDAHLRTIAKVLIDEHQLSLDIGSDGGGANTRPFLEESSLAFERLYFKLKDGVEVHATYKDESFMQGTTEDAQSYEWIEEAACKWVELAVADKVAGGGE